MKGSMIFPCSTCITSEINCGIPPPPSLRGGYAYSGTEYGDQVTYDCECGYDLDGEQVLTCGETGEWGQPPCCRSKYTQI